MLKQLLGESASQQLRRFKPLLAEINRLEASLEGFSDAELRGLTAEYREQLQAIASQPLREKRLLDALLPPVYALVREGSRRVLGLRHHDVQLLGGIVLHHGSIAEMQTGEGKTLVSTLPAFLNGLTGKGVHAVTANDYLARRDAELMGQVHRFLGLRVGLIQSGMATEQRRQQYSCDITYATNAELGFDYLRDNMAGDPNQLVQRQPYFCIIDEVDSILIDEARTPLIISGQVDRPKDTFIRAAAVAAQLQRCNESSSDSDNAEPQGDYEVDERQRRCSLTEQGYERAAHLLGVSDLFDAKAPWAQFVLSALTAKDLFVRDVDYIVREQQVVIVDQGTGRVMAGRRWSDGQHQAIEAKEGVPIQPETETLAAITYQHYFRLYERLAGMTGTGSTEAQEFATTYNLAVIPVPTHRPSQRHDWDDQVFHSETAKWNAVAAEVETLHHEGRPVLVGTTSVDTSQRLSALLSARGIAHKLLNARPELVERESEIVAQAGRRGAVTIATNMAGRGTDIILGGNSEFMARLKVRERLVPPLLAADAPRPAQPPNDGSFYPCPLTDACGNALELLAKQLADVWGSQQLSLLDLEERISQAAEKAPSHDPWILELRQRIREVKQEYAAVLQPEAEQVRAAGGLHVIGTERHDSRRVDNQLRGRAGRQGDPGSTRFFLSLDDNLMRIFAGEKLARLMTRLQFDEAMPIESGVLSRTLEQAQRTVENVYYDQRKQVFLYDEVMNIQRRALYAERRRALASHDSKAQVLSYGVQALCDLVETHANPDLQPAQWRLEELVSSLRALIPLPRDLQADSLAGLTSEEIQELLCEQLRIMYDVKEARIEQQRPGLMRQVERFFTLQQIDLLWRQHLQAMAALKESVNLRSYAQKDPLLEYKNEGYDLFLTMMARLRHNVLQLMFAFQPTPQPAAAAPPAPPAATPAPTPPPLPRLVL
ncbi:MAG: preprotein translocase subunit SecA [Vulcanococcus sp.]